MNISRVSCLRCMWQRACNLNNLHGECDKFETDYDAEEREAKEIEVQEWEWS